MPQIPAEQIEIAEFLKTLKFKKKLMGVDEADVWKQLEKLNDLYQAAIAAERVRYNALLEERMKAVQTENGADDGKKL